MMLIINVFTGCVAKEFRLVELAILVVFKLSRFGRNAADVLNSLQYIQDFGVNLICVEDGISITESRLIIL